MMRISLQGVLETSLLGRIVLWLVAVWENSLLARAASRLGRWGARIFWGSLIGKIIASDWPSAAVSADSRVGRLLAAFNDRLARLGERVRPFLSSLLASSGLARVVSVAWGRIEPVLHTSFLVRGFTGFAWEVALAPAERAARRTPWIVYALGALLGLAPLLPSATSLMIVGVWGLGLLWLVQKVLTGNYQWRASSAFLPLLFLLGVAAAATVQSVAMKSSVLNLTMWLTAGMLFFMIVNLVRNTRDAAVLLGPVFAGAVLMTVWAVYQFFYPPVIDERWVDPTTSGDIVRVFASMGNPNYLAEYMALFLPLALAMLLHVPKRRLVMVLIIGAMTLSLLLTYSRGGWLAFAIAVVAIVLLRLRRYAGVFVLGALAVPVMAPESIWRRLMSAFTLEDSSNAYRVSLWTGTMDMIREYWALGVGLGAGAFGAVYSEFALAAARAAHAHNTYLQVMAEMGILGLIAVLWVLFVVIKRTAVLGADRHRSALLAAVPAALVGMLAHGLVEHIWYNPKLLFAFWAVAALGMGLALGDGEDAAA